MKNDIKYILYMVDNEYTKFLEGFDILDNDIDWASMLRLALNNRILYCFSKAVINKIPLSDYEFNVLNTINKDGDKWIKRFYNTLNFLEKYLGYKNFIVIKTFKFSQDITFDVDIFPSDLSEQINKIPKEIGFELRGIHAGYEYKTKNDNYLTIDLYHDFMFKTKRIADNNFICNVPRFHKAKNGDYYIPNIEGELLLFISQINFQTRFITLHDFLQITKMILENKGKINWEILLTEVTKHNWKNSFINTLSIISSLYSQLYGKQLEIPITINKNVRCSFPYYLSPLSIFKYDSEIFKYSYFKKQFIRDLQYLQYEFLCVIIRKRIPIYHDWISIDDLIKKKSMQNDFTN